MMNAPIVFSDSYMFLTTMSENYHSQSLRAFWSSLVAQQVKGLLFSLLWL